MGSRENERRGFGDRKICVKEFSVRVSGEMGMMTMREREGKVGGCFL